MNSQFHQNTVCWECHKAQYHSRLAVHKPLITPCNAPLQVQWCKEPRKWTTKQWRNDMVRWIIHHNVLDKQMSACVRPTKRTRESWVLGFNSEGFWWFCDDVGYIFLAWFGCSHPLEGKVNANRYLMGPSNHLHPMLQHFFPSGRGVFQDDNAPPTENVWSPNGLMSMTHVIHMSWPSQSPDLNPIEHLWDSLEWRLRQRFPPPPNRFELINFLVVEWCRIPPAESQTLVDSMSRRIQAPQAARGGPTPY